MITERPMLDVVNESFERYSGNVILDRAICDARDMLKPSARMLLYSQLKISKNTFNRPFIKSARIVGDCIGRYYEHGDSSCYGAYMRMSKPFAMRYPLEICQGNNGTVVMLDDEAAMRYTELKMAPLSQYLYGGLEDDAIKDWRINFDKTEHYPTVMPSIGYYNICNGTIGLGIGISSQIPQFNLKEVNEALIKLIRNPKVSDDEITIMPDFATGAILTNPEEVQQSLMNGSGKACTLRAKMQYNSIDNSIKVTEIPYSIGTDIIREEIAKLLEKDENYGVDNISDKSGKTVDFTIYLKKGVSPKQMIAKLYKDTSLESTFPINMWVLDKGRYPMIMGLRSLFCAYIDHCRVTETNILTHETLKLNERKNIVDGLLKANSDIDNIVKLIRGSASTEDAKTQLLALGYNDEQAAAILSIRLSSLTKLDTAALTTEQKEIINNLTWHNDVLGSATKLDEEIIKKLEEVAEKFGDNRRTTIISKSELIEDKITDKSVGLILFDNNMMRAVDTEELQISNRGRKGTNIKAPRGAQVKSIINTTLSGFLALFTDAGKMYTFSAADMTIGTDYSVYEFVQLQNNSEKAVEIVDATTMADNRWIIFLTKNGIIKRTKVEEYATKIRTGFIALKLEEDDLVQKVFFTNNLEDKIMIATNKGYYTFYSLDEVSETGRVTKGIRAVLLKNGGHVVDADIIKNNENYYGIFSITQNGIGKITTLDNFPTTSRAVQGNLIMKLTEEDEVTAIAAIKPEITKLSIFNGKNSTIKLEDIPVQNRSTRGVSIIDNKQEKNSIRILML